MHYKWRKKKKETRRYRLVQLCATRVCVCVCVCVCYKECNACPASIHFTSTNADWFAWKTKITKGTKHAY